MHYLHSLIPNKNLKTCMTTRHVNSTECLAIENPMRWPVKAMNQIHSDFINIVNDKQETEQPECDAMISNLSQVFLMVKTADCLPILVDAPMGVIAAIHAGRRGTISEITKQTLMKMNDVFQVDLNKTILWLGPAICVDCYEILIPNNPFDKSLHIMNNYI